MIEEADAIFVLGSNDSRVAEYAADLFFDGFAPYIIFSEGLGRGTIGVFAKPEADLFADIAIKRGVPAEKVLVENKATNTNEKKLLIHIMVDDLQRIKLYPEKGFQIPQAIPTEVWHAYEQLVQAGYTEQLLKE